jgi:hypothetical protein
LRRPDHGHQPGAVDQLDVAPFGELLGVRRELARRDYEPADGSLGSHDAVQLTHKLDSNAEGFPLLALNEELLAALAQHQVDATVCTAGMVLCDVIALQPEGFTDEDLELLPGDSLQRLPRLAGCHVRDQSIAPVAPDG